MKKIILWGSLILVVIILLGMNTVSNTERTPVVENTSKPLSGSTRQIVTIGPYTNNLDVLEATVIDEEKDVKAIYIHTIIGFLTDFDPKVQEYPFYATKNRKGDGYIGIVVTDIGKAVFLIPNYETLNETDKTALEGMVKAVNGTAKSLNPKIEFANGYDALEVLDWVE